MVEAADAIENEEKEKVVEEKEPVYRSILEEEKKAKEEKM